MSDQKPTFRIITGSYSHNLLCLSLTLYPASVDSKVETVADTKVETAESKSSPNGDLKEKKDDIESKTLSEKDEQSKYNAVFTPIFHFTPHTQSIRCLAQSKRYLVSGSNDEHIRIYDLQKRKELGTLLHHDGDVNCLGFSPDGKWLLSGASDGKICIWRTKDWEVLGEIKGPGVQDLDVHPTGRIAISVGNDNSLRLWNLMTAKKASALKLNKREHGELFKCAWAGENGKYFILGFDRKIVIYSIETSRPIGRVLKLNSGLQNLAVYSVNDVEYVVASLSNGVIIFVPVEELTKESEDELTLSELPESAFKLVGHGVRVKDFSFFEYEPSGVKYMTSVSSDGNIVVWDLNTRDQVAVYNTSDRLNCCLMVSEDIEKYEKRRVDDAVSEAEETEYESEVEEKPAKRQRKNKKNKKSKNQVKKAKLTIEYS